LPVLRWIIQQGGDAVQELLNSVDRGREALGNVRELAERRMKQLAHPVPASAAARRRTTGARRDGRGLLNEILELPQKQLEQLQHRIDAQVRASLERVTGHPAFQNELRRIARSIRGLEHQLSRLRRHQRGGSTARRPKASVPRKGVGS